MKQLLFVIFLLSSAFTHAQTFAIKGKVMANKQPVSFATIGIATLNKTTLSDEQGAFMLKNIPAGTFQLQVSVIGYERQKILVQPEKEKELRIELVPLNTSLKELTISGTMREVSKSSSPVPVEIYGHQFFKKTPSNSLFESLQMINGVQPTLNCNVCNTGDIHINGLDGPYTLVLIDGMPIISALSTVYGLSGIPNSMIEKVEVVKGPAATLYGSEAVGGLINVITKSPETAPRFSLNYYASSYKEQNLDVGYAKRFGKVSTLLSGNLFYFQNRVDINKDNFTDITLQKRVSVFGKLTWNRTEKLRTSLAARVYYEDRMAGELTYNKAFRGGDSVYGESIYTKRAELLVSHPFLIAKQAFKYQLSWNIHDQNSAYGQSYFIAQQWSAFNQLLLEKKIGIRHQTLMGAALRVSNYQDNAPIGGQADVFKKMVIPGVFVQDEIALTSNQTLLLGARADHYSWHGLIFSPRANYKVNFGSTQTLRLSAGNGFRVVNIFTEDHAALSGAREVIVAPNIKPENSWNVNVNYSRWHNLPAGFFEWDITAFYTWFGNKIVPDYDTDASKIYYQNLNGHAISQGLTLNTGWNFVFPLKINAGFTLMEVYSLNADSNGIMEKQMQMHAPKFSGTYQVAYTFKRLNMVIDYTAQVYGPMRLPVVPNDFRPAYSPWFSLHHLQITKKWGSGFECFGSVRNLGNFLPQNPILRWWDPFNKTAGDAQSNPNKYQFDPSYNYAPMMGRNVVLGFRYNLK
ncbi:MAG: TonB-dependent receptor [bacterium]|nr:TonB-dependent receptor [bacterium]